MAPILGILASSMQGAVGDFESIATVSVGAGGSSSISFTSIPSTYKHLQIRAIQRDNSGTGGLTFLRAKLNADATSGNYYGHYVYGNGASASAGATVGATNGLICGFVANDTNTSNSFATAIIDFLDYSNTSKYKTTRSLGGADFNTTSGGVALISGLYMSTTAISSIELTADAGTGFIQYSSFALYGVK